MQVTTRAEDRSGLWISHDACSVLTLDRLRHGSDFTHGGVTVVMIPTADA